MRYYVIQSKEEDMKFELFDSLAAVLGREKGILKASAKIQIRTSHGIFEFPDYEAAERISEGFQQAGLDNFVLPEDGLAVVPKAEPVRELSQLENMDLGLLAAGRILKEEKTTTTQRAMGRYAGISGMGGGMGIGGVRIPGSSSRKTTHVRIKKSFYIDMFTQDRHLRKKSELVMHEKDRLRQLSEGQGIYLGEGIRDLLEGRKNIISFGKERVGKEGDYDRYLNWLFQLRYARP